jgi:two-component system phosphate regulon sensor histidine kinase PhoR
VAEVAAMMGPYAAEHGFTIATDLGQLKPISFDRDALAQIVVNLLDNAVKYARSAEDKTIVVRTRDSERFTVVEVEDHGPGVPHRQRKRVFEQFYRCAAESAGPGSPVAGTGLGLALVSRFAQAHDGFVEVLSAQPQGAIFRVGLTTPTV